MTVTYLNSCNRVRLLFAGISLSVFISASSISASVFAQSVAQPVPGIDDKVLDGDLDTVAFDQVLERALNGNPLLEMADARVVQANEQVNQSGSYRFPRLEASAAVGPEHNDPAPSAESGHALTHGRNLNLTMTQLLYDGSSSRSEYQRSQKLAEASQAEAQIELENVFLEIMSAYIEYWRYQQDWDQAKTFVLTMEKLINDLETMFKAGGASKIEVDFARARLASARAATSEAQASMNNAFSELEFLVPGLKPFKPQSPESFHTLKLQPVSVYLDQGALKNTGFVTNKLSIEATALRVRAQKGRYRPSLDFELSGSLIEDEGGPSEVRGKAAAKLLLSYTIFSGGERKAGIRRAEAQLRELTAERMQLERDVFRTIDQAYNAVNASRITLNAVVDEIAANMELQRLNNKNLALGTINIIELIDVEERLFNAQSRKNGTVSTMHQEYFNLLIAVGSAPATLSAFNVSLPTQ